jgi:uncharacterized protein YdeI (YjbR/CyaY-like superfamily)
MNRHHNHDEHLAAPPDNCPLCDVYMPITTLLTLEISSRRQWRRWLQKHHDSVTEIWLVFHKLHTGEKCIPYEDALDEALCYGWIDSLVKRLDNDRYARKFTPRKPDSHWSTINCRRYAKLKAMGRLAAPGLERAPTAKSVYPPKPRMSADTSYIEKALKSNSLAWATFQQLSPACRRAYLGWIDTAKRDETKQKRLREAIALLAAGKKLGLK